MKSGKTLFGQSIRSMAVASGLLATSVLAIGCGQAQNGGMASMLKNVQIRTYESQGDVYAEVVSQISTGNLIISGLDLPVVNPRRPDQVYGRISIRSSFCQAGQLCSGSELALAVNLTDVIQSDAAGVINTLPNGTAIPIGGLQNATLVGMPIANSKAIAYAGYGSQIALLGAALPFKQMDQVGQYVPGVNLFQPFNANGIQGIIGLFTGANEGGNGIALFVDFSQLIHGGAQNKVLADAKMGSTLENLSALLQKQGSGQAFQAANQRLEFKTVRPSALREFNLYQQMDKLNKRGGTLQVR